MNSNTQGLCNQCLETFLYQNLFITPRYITQQQVKLEIQEFETKFENILVVYQGPIWSCSMQKTGDEKSHGTVPLKGLS